MFKFKCEIKGLDKLEKKINTIIKELPSKVQESVEDILKNIQGYAIHLLGTSNNGIVCELVKTDTKEIIGRVYTDQNKMPWSWFREFGTGIWAEQPHIGTTKHFLETNYEEWYIPVSKAGRDLSYPIININNTQFYVAHSAQSNPFMRPAGFETREQNIEIIKNKLYAMLKEVCKQ